MKENLGKGNRSQTLTEGKKGSVINGNKIRVKKKI